MSDLGLYAVPSRCSWGLECYRGCCEGCGTVVRGVNVTGMPVGCSDVAGKSNATSAGGTENDSHSLASTTRNVMSSAVPRDCPAQRRGPSPNARLSALALGRAFMPPAVNHWLGSKWRVSPDPRVTCMHAYTCVLGRLQRTHTLSQRTVVRSPSSFRLRGQALISKQEPARTKC